MPTRSPLSTIVRHSLLVVAAIGALPGCMPGYRPGGSQSSRDEFTFESTNDTPKTVKLVDWTTNTTIWTLDVPVGRAVVVRFYEDHDPKNQTRPTLMRWEMFENGHEHGELNNAIPAPDKSHRRLDWDVRKTSTAVPAPEAAAKSK